MTTESTATTKRTGSRTEMRARTRRAGQQSGPALWEVSLPALLCVVAAMLGCGTGDPNPALEQTAPEPVATRVVYAGDAGTPHAASFHALLAEHFEVQSIAVADLATADLSDADVLIVDGQVIDTSEERSTVIAAPVGVTLETLNLPTVLIGGKGAQISDNLNLKLGWRFG